MSNRFSYLLIYQSRRLNMLLPFSLGGAMFKKGLFAFYKVFGTGIISLFLLHENQNNAEIVIRPHCENSCSGQQIPTGDCMYFNVLKTMSHKNWQGWVGCELLNDSLCKIKKTIITLLYLIKKEEYNISYI